MFHAAKLSLTKWFLATYLLTHRKNSISALQVSRGRGVKYGTTWRLKHELMQVMLERGQRHLLGGRVEIDDAYLGRERPGKRGCGSENKVLFVAAVETTLDGRPRKVHLRRVGGFTTNDISRYARSHLLSGTTVFSDGLSCFGAVGSAGCVHTPIVTGSGRQAAQHPTYLQVGQYAPGGYHERVARNLPCNR